MYKTIVMILSVVLLLGCTTDNVAKDCSMIACTLDFRSFSITITNGAGSPIALDRFEVTELISGDDLTLVVSDDDFELMKQTGVYPLYGDQFASKHQNESLDIVFKGFIGANEVVNALFNVGADCCHAGINSGDLEVVVN